MTQSPTTRPSLLVRLTDSRDDEAWREFIAIYEPVIYTMVRRRGLQDADAREIVQEVLLSVSRSIATFDFDADGTFGGWLTRITRNATVDRLRRLSTRRETIDDAAARDGFDKAVANTDLESEFDIDWRQQLFRFAAAEVRARTGETNWMAFWRTAVEGQSVPAVAKQLGIAEGAVYVARCRILKRIREAVDQRTNH